MNLDKLLNIKYPVIQGGMANITDGKFAAAVSNAGALGTIGSGGMKADVLEKEIEICRELTDKPFAVNLIMFRSDIEELVDVVCRAKVPYLIAYIAEGMEAGGHIGEMTTMTLIYQVANATEKPVIAGGGIGSGAQMLAAEVLGAVGVQIGTAFLFTNEVPVHDKYKELLLNTESHSITSIGYLNGRPMRLVKNPMTREFKELERTEQNKDALEDFTLGRLRKAVYEGDVDQGSVMAGYTAAQFDRLYSVPELLEKLMDEYEATKSSVK